MPSRLERGVVRPSRVAELSSSISLLESLVSQTKDDYGRFEFLPRSCRLAVVQELTDALRLAGDSAEGALKEKPP